MVQEAAERRRFERFRADLPVVLSVVGEEEITSVRGRCQSISQGGLAATVPLRLNSGEMVTLELAVPNSAKPLWMEGLVRRQDSNLGLEFLSLSEEQRQAIKRYCLLQPREKRRN